MSGDLLTSYDGRTITYDNVGNPLSDGVRTYTWQKGRQLSELTQNGVTWEYTYDANGLRTKKKNKATQKSVEYIYSGGQLRYMSEGMYSMIFEYDAKGVPVAVICNDTRYFYITNLQGDVVAIIDENGCQVAEYEYDAWGNLISWDFGSNTITQYKDIGLYNPLRYRGYVYDRETGLYYLQSRYYNPEWGRFINADAYISTETGLIGYNMFAYCNNNPVNCYDPSGQGAITTLLVTALVCGVLSFGADVAGQMVFEQKTLDNIDWRSATISGISGFCAGLIPGSGFWSLTGQAVVSSLVDNGLRAIWMGEDFQINNVIMDSAILLGTGYVMKGVSNLSQKLTSKIFCKAPNYSQYQHYFRSKGHNYSRQEVYTHMRKYMQLQNLADEAVDSFLDFTSSFLLYPV